MKSEKNEITREEGERDRRKKVTFYKRKEKLREGWEGRTLMNMKK